MGFGNVQVSNEKGPLVGLGDLLGIVLPSYVGIVRNQRNHHRDPYWTTGIGIMESKAGLFFIVQVVLGREQFGENRGPQKSLRIRRDLELSPKFQSTCCVFLFSLQGFGFVVQRFFLKQSWNTLKTWRRTKFNKWGYLDAPGPDSVFVCFTRRQVEDHNIYVIYTPEN